MNMISLMMVSYAYYCPEHDGYAWPVKNPRLAPLRDRSCRNADPRTEFVGKALDYAKGKGFHCQLMMNAMIWNPDRVAGNARFEARQSMTGSSSSSTRAPSLNRRTDSRDPRSRLTALHRPF